MNFTEVQYDFGTITEGQKVEKKFLFTNSSKTNLQITGVRGSCGCTVAEYPKEPVAPNKTGIIKVSYNSKGKHGKQSKTVTITANTTKGTETLKIYADVKATSQKTEYKN